jgi:hypothetical protein
MLLAVKKIASTQITPEVILDPAGVITIKGRSMLPDITQFSREIDNWLDKYLSDPQDLTCVDFHMEYINTTNVKFYVSLLTRMECLKLKNKNYTVNWYYDEGDEDIIEKGEYISSVVEMPFNFILVSDPIVNE